MIQTNSTTAWHPPLTAVPGASSAKVLRFHKYKPQDPQGIGGEAASMLVPRTGRWTRVVWAGTSALPAFGVVQATAPDGVTQFEAFPQMPFVDGVREMTAARAQMPARQVALQAAAQWPEGAKLTGQRGARVVRNPQTFIDRFVCPATARTSGTRW